MTKTLIIDEYRKQIIDAINENQVILIRGQTGCGKSTRVPQFIFEDGGKEGGKIGVMLPRTVAATALAEYVSKQMKDSNSVSCRYRFKEDDKVGSPITYMTIGSLLNDMNENGECIFKYLIIDDVHERSIQTDILLGKMKQFLTSKKQIKIIIMSALFNVKAFEEFFKDFQCKFIDIPRKPSNIKITYEKCSDEKYVEAIQKVIIKRINEDNKQKENQTNDSKDKNKNKESYNENHILVFLPTESKVLRLKNLLNKSTEIKEKCKIFKVFSNMLPKEKEKIFDKTTERKIIVSTNILENGLTIPGLKYVIDCGRVRRFKYDNTNNAVASASGRITIAEAEQRKGLLGRMTNEGECIRVYDNPFKLMLQDFLLKIISTKIQDEDLIKKCKEIITDLKTKRFERFYDELCNSIHEHFDGCSTKPHTDLTDDAPEYFTDGNKKLTELLRYLNYPENDLENYEMIIKLLIREIMDCIDHFKVKSTGSMKKMLKNFLERKIKDLLDESDRNECLEYLEKLKSSELNAHFSQLYECLQNILNETGGRPNEWIEDDEENLKKILVKLYPQEEFNDMNAISHFLYQNIKDTAKKIDIGVLPIPDVPRCNYMTLIINLLAIGETDVFNFPFLDSPNKDEMLIALKRLTHLSLIYCEHKKYCLTNIGKEVVKFPLDPLMAKVIYIAKNINSPIKYEEENLYKKTIIISALDQMKTLYLKHFDRIEDDYYADDDGDLFKYLNVWHMWENSYGCEGICRQDGLNYSNLNYSNAVIKQLWYKKIIEKPIDIKLSYKGFYSKSWRSWLKMCFISGYCHNIAIKTGEDTFRVLNTTINASIDKYSCLNIKNTKIVLFLSLSYNESDQKRPYRLRNVIALNKRDITDFDQKSLKVHGDFWKDVLKEIKTTEIANKL